MRRSFIVLALAAVTTGATACSDTRDLTAPAAPVSTPAATRDASNTAPTDAAPADTPLDALIDALERVGPTLGDNEDAAAVRAQLGALLQQPPREGRGLAGHAALPAVVAALDRLERADPALAPEIDAIRLALAPLLDAARMHKPF
jgi:hypothetical protein